MDWTRRINTFYASQTAAYHFAGTKSKLQPGTYPYAYVDGVPIMPKHLFRPWGVTLFPEELKQEQEAIRSFFETQTVVPGLHDPLEETWGHYRHTWYEVGKQNWGISRAWDPTFKQESIYFCESTEEMCTLLLHGNWSTGVAFAYRNQCWINQVNGGDEWLVIKGSTSFESVTASAVAGEKGCPLFVRGQYGFNRLANMIEKIDRLTEAEIRAGADYSPDGGY